VRGLRQSNPGWQVFARFRAQERHLPQIGKKKQDLAPRVMKEAVEEKANRHEH
jgi:hypothetical protein